MDTIEKFITQVLQGGDLMQTARHEAGHRFMWRLACPEVATHYVVTGGLPAVVQTSSHSRKISEMSMEDASKMTYIKLAGHVSEMMYLGLTSDEDIEAIVDWLVKDYYSKPSRLDWRDDANCNGDISEAFLMIGGKVGWSRENLKQNTLAIFKSIIHAIQANEVEYEAECNEAYQQFAVWQAQGKIII